MMTCRCFLFEYFSQPQRLPLIFFWQNENITKQISNENNGKPLIGGFCLTRHSSYTKIRFWTTGSHVCSTRPNEAPRCIRSYFFNVSGEIRSTHRAMLEERKKKSTCVDFSWRCGQTAKNPLAHGSELEQNELTRN